MRAKQGLSLIEAVIALAILAILLVAVIPGFVNFSQTNTRMEIRSGAVAAAQQVLDGLRTQGGAWPTGLTVDSGLRIYDVDVVVCTEGSSSDCYTSSDARHVRLEVNFDGTTYYEVETVFTGFD